MNHNILHLITSLEVGGAEVMLSRLLEAMSYNRYRHSVVCLTGEGRIGKEIASFGIKVTYLNMPHGRISLNGMRSLSKLIKTGSPVILQTWLYHADLIGLLLGRWCHVPHVCWNIRCSYIDLTQYRFTTRLVLKCCAAFSRFPHAIVSNSIKAVKFHKSLGYKNESWRIIPNGINTNKFKPDREARKKLIEHVLSLKHPDTPQHCSLENIKFLRHPFIIGCIARFDPMKDHATFLRAAKILLGHKINAHFVLVGRDVTWTNSFFSKRINDSCRHHFHLLGERSDIEKIMPGFDIASLSSSGEGFPNVIAEAMACGIPCVATDVGDCEKIIEDCGVVVPPCDAEALADGWLKILELNEEERHQLGNQARQRIKNNYDISFIAESYETFYQALIEGSHRGIF